MSDVLDIGPSSCVALIGGGGKTTLMLAMARELHARAFRPVVTTTTRIWVPQDIPLVLRDPALLRSVLEEHGIACFGGAVSSEGKLDGVDPRVLCTLMPQGFGPLLIEADGSAGRPLKFHADHEPVIPACSTDVLVVAAVDGVGRPADAATVHRAELAAEAFGWSAAECIAPSHVASLLLRMLAYAPPGGCIRFVLNKVDAPGQDRVADQVAEYLRTAGHPILFTRRGKVMKILEPAASARPRQES